jgi:hypothetical protein
MTDENRDVRSEVKTIAETAVKIDQILTRAKEMTAKLKSTSDALNQIVSEEEKEKEEKENNAPSE